MFSVCTILYGDYFHLAEKLLSSLERNAHVKDFRIGLNAVCERTVDYVHGWAANNMAAQPIFLFQEEVNSNVGKYPLMRQMFRFPEIGKQIMWFDDDSYLDAAAGTAWWDGAKNCVKRHTQVGAVHTIMQRGKQFEAIAQQPWYNHKPVNSRHRFRFATGGWWTAKSEFLAAWDYPFLDIHHNGGDSILGELIRQRNGSIGSYAGGMQCHCESCSRKGISYGKPVVHINVGGRAGRRGIGVKGEKYVWSNGLTSQPATHQNFNLKVYRYEV